MERKFVHLIYYWHRRKSSKPNYFGIRKEVSEKARKPNPTGVSDKDSTHSRPSRVSLKGRDMRSWGILMCQKFCLTFLKPTENLILHGLQTVEQRWWYGAFGTWCLCQQITVQKPGKLLHVFIPPPSRSRTKVTWKEKLTKPEVTNGHGEGMLLYETEWMVLLGLKGNVDHIEFHTLLGDNVEKWQAGDYIYFLHIGKCSWT